MPAKTNGSSTTEKTETSETTTTQRVNTVINAAKSSKHIRFPVVRSETVPDGFKGKIEEKRQKHNLTSLKNQLGNGELIKPDTYVTVTKSVSGSLDSSKTPTSDDKKFESTYYTKSSTCGYFTFSCNIVYGSNGRSKICRPKAPANGKC